MTHLAQNSQSGKKRNPRLRRLPGMAAFSRLRIRPQLAASLIAIAFLAVAVPVAYSAWKRIPLDRQDVIGQWATMLDENLESAKPSFGISFSPDGQVVFMNATGASWTGDFRWQDRIDQQSGFRPDAATTVSFATVLPDHAEAPVLGSDGYAALDGLLIDPPSLNGQPVVDLFLRRDGDRLWVGYPTSAQWQDGKKELLAGWLQLTKISPNRDRVIDTLRDLPEEPRDAGSDNPTSLSVSQAIDAAMKGSKFEYQGTTTFRYGCYAHSQFLDAATMLKLFGVADEARQIRPFEKPVAYNGPDFTDAQLFRYGSVTFITDPAGKLLYVGVNPSEQA